MDLYLYVCDNDHERQIKTRAWDTTEYFCGDCSLEMLRKPTKLPHVRVRVIGFNSKEK